MSDNKKRNNASPLETKTIWNAFVKMFPILERSVRVYTPVDRVTLKLDMYDRKSLIFNYIDEGDWRLQTYKNFIDSSRASNKSDNEVLRKENKMNV